MDKYAPIGIFDSGIGGIGVLKDIVKSLPGEDVIYYGDNKNAPYGTKTEEKIKELALECAKFLKKKGAKAIVTACNTASMTAVYYLREKMDTPIIGMEPAIKPASYHIKDGKMLVMATPASLHQDFYFNRVKNYKLADKIINLPCPELVDAVEHGNMTQDELEKLIHSLISHYKHEDIKAIVIGCTHFLHVKDLIKKAARQYFDDIKLFDGNDGVIRQLKRVLEEKDMLNPRSSGGKIQFFTSGEETVYIPLFYKYLNA